MVTDMAMCEWKAQWVSNGVCRLRRLNRRMR